MVYYSEWPETDLDLLGEDPAAIAHECDDSPLFSPMPGRW